MQLVKRTGLILLVLFLTPATAADSGGGGRGLALADAMLGMMDRLGMLGERNPQWPRQNHWTGGMPWQSMGGVAPGMGGAWPGPAYPWTSVDPQGWFPVQPGNHRLNGLWQGLGGERLLIDVPRFRLQADARRSVQGRLVLRDNHLMMQTEDAGRPLVFEFAENQGRLALRGADGNLYLYRLIQRPGNPATTPPMTGKPTMQ